MSSKDRAFMAAHIHARCMTWPLSELSQLSGAFLLHPSIPLSRHLSTCSPLRACVCRQTLLGACLTFFLLHNTRRHTCSSSSWASIKKSTSLFFHSVFLLFLLSLIPFLCLLFEVSPGPSQSLINPLPWLDCIQVPSVAISNDLISF